MPGLGFAALFATHCNLRFVCAVALRWLQVYGAMLDKWALYRRQFRSVWDAVSEGLEGKEVRALACSSRHCLNLHAVGC